MFRPILKQLDNLDISLAYKQIIKEVAERIIHDYKSGMSSRAIADKYTTTKSFVLSLLNEAGVERRPQQIERIISKEVLVEKFLNEKKPIRIIAEELNCGYNTVVKNLKDHNIIFIPRKRKEIFSIQEKIIKDYNEGLSSLEIAKKYGASKAGILRILREKNIKFRITKKTIDKDFLVEEYVNKKRSIEELKKETGSHYWTLKRNLNLNGISLRNFNEQGIINNKKIRRGEIVNDKNPNLLKNGIENDVRFFYILGALKGDGHYNLKQNKIQFAVTDMDFVDEMKRLFSDMSPQTRLNIMVRKKATAKTKTQYGFCLCCADFYEKGFHKLEPQTLEEKRFYLKGLFDAEGSASANGSSITITQKNLDALRKWKGYLLELGMNSNESINKITNIGRLYLIGLQSKINFFELIGFKIKRKQDRVEKYIKKIAPLPEYNISSNEKIKTVKIKSIKFSHKEKGIDISVFHKDHNFFSSDGIQEKNSTLAMQVGYYIAWILAGGRTILDENGNTLQHIPPKQKVRFGLNHIVFAPEDLKKKAHELPPNSVIIYDEGRAGLDSSRSMESVNKGMQDFFQECGVFGHVILIVLPDFFQLHQTYAVSRSLFLLNVFTDEKFQRGYFSFYNEAQKELLYFWGKKKVGASFRYMSAKRNFWGKFTNWIPVDRDIYEKTKKEALMAKSIGRKQIQELKERDLLIHYLIMKMGVSRVQLEKDMENFGYNTDTMRFSLAKIDRALRNVERLWAGTDYYPDGQEELDDARELQEFIVKKLKERQECRKKGIIPQPIMDKEYWLRKMGCIKSEKEEKANKKEAEYEVEGEEELSSETTKILENSNPPESPKELSKEFIGEGIMPEEIPNEPPALGENLELPKDD